jgi:transposase
VLLTARGSAVDARSDTQRQIHALVVAAPELIRSRFRDKTPHQVIALVVAAPELIRSRFRDKTPHQVIASASRLRCGPHQDLESRTTITVLRALARRVLELEAETREHERQLTEIVRSWRPDLLEERGVGPVVAATLLCAWSHAGRFRSEAAFASLAGASPIPASSGMTVRHRLNRGGDRQLNRALHVVVINRIRTDEATRAYVERRRAEGKTEREIKRCLKRYVARQLFRQLEGDARVDKL